MQRMLSPQVDKATGYPKVHLRGGDRGRSFFVHRLVALTFLGECPVGYQVAHINGVRTDATLKNLRYDTQRGNEKDKLEHGTMLRGDQAPWSKLTSSQVREIRSSSKRVCELARSFGVSSTIVSQIRSGLRWKHI